MSVQEQARTGLVFLLSPEMEAKTVLALVLYAFVQKQGLGMQATVLGEDFRQYWDTLEHLNSSPVLAETDYDLGTYELIAAKLVFWDHDSDMLALNEAFFPFFEAECRQYIK